MNENTVTPEVTQTVDASAPAVVTTPDAVVVTEVVKAPKEPSKMSLAKVMFAARLAERAAGLIVTNRDFRVGFCLLLESELKVSSSSAATMYNTLKKEAVAADPMLVLGRDPKVEKPVVVKVGNAKRGRPAKVKTDTVVAPAASVEITLVAGEIVPEVTAEVTPAAESVGLVLPAEATVEVAPAEATAEADAVA